MFVNTYPTLDINHELVKGEHTAGSPIFIKVGLAWDTDEEDGKGDDQMVVAPFYSFKKMANWWLVVGNSTSHQLLVIKHMTVTRSLSIKLEFTLPKGKHSLHQNWMRLITQQMVTMQLPSSSSSSSSLVPVDKALPKSRAWVNCVSSLCVHS